jgi:hypothetical protein
MLRPSPLNRKSWIKRTACALRRVPIKKISSKRTALAADRKRCREIVLARAQGRCQVTLPHTCQGEACDVHEIKRRGQGGSILDPANCVACCRNGHRYLHDHPAEARAMGLLKRSWES